MTSNLLKIRCPHCGEQSLSAGKVIVSTQFARGVHCPECGKVSSYAASVLNATTMAGVVIFILSIVMSIDVATQAFRPVRFGSCLLGGAVLLGAIFRFAKLHAMREERKGPGSLTVFALLTLCLLAYILSLRYG